MKPRSSSRGGAPRSGRDGRGSAASRPARSDGSGRAPRGSSAPRPSRSGGPRRDAPRAAVAAPSRARSRPPASIDRIIATQKWDAVAPHVVRAGGEPGPVIEQLRRFTRDLLEWNRGASNLISGADEARVVERHVIESIEPAHWMRASGLARWLDLGSGGGFPAIPLALCGVGERWTLVESRRTKTLFLRKFIQDLALTNIAVINERIENLLDSPELADQFDGFTSRATIKLGPTLTAARHFVRVGGEAFLWKGSGRDQEMQDDPSWRGFWRLDGFLTIGAGPTVVCRFIRER